MPQAAPPSKATRHTSARRVRFAFVRPWLFIRGVLVRRDRPDLAHLAGINDPERFVWAVLPHAARTFAPSIVALPYRRAMVAAVGYLYARMLDTYEDLEGHLDAKLSGLAGFSRRFETLPPAPPPAIEDPVIGDDRDRVHLLLIDRCSLVDRVFLSLSADDRTRIIEMLGEMSSGMQRFSRIFHDQGGALIDDAQVEDYCHTVIGHPISFTMRLLVGEVAADRCQDDARELSVLIQLANITRDIEKDLERGIAYRPELRRQLGSRPGSADARQAVAGARRSLVSLALRHAAAYRRLVDDLELSSFSLARGSAVLMATYTDRHYRREAKRSGVDPWRGPNSSLAIWAVALTAVASRRWTSRVFRRIEKYSATARRRLATTAASGPI